MSEREKFYYFEQEQDARSWRGLYEHVWLAQMMLYETDTPHYLQSRKDEVEVQADIRYTEEQEPGKPYYVRHLHLNFCKVCHHRRYHDTGMGRFMCYDKCGKTWIVNQGIYFNATGMFWNPPPIYMCCGGDWGQHKSHCPHYRKPKAEAYNPWR